MYPYPVKPKQLWGLGAILVTLVVVGVATTLVLPPGDSSSSEDFDKGTLASGSGTQVGCTWSGGCPEGVREIDFYKLGIPVPADALVVAEGSDMIFEHDAVSAEMFPVCNVSSMYNNDGFNLKCEQSEDRIEVPANMPPGEYGLEISVASESEEGSISYGFHILVEEAG